MLWRSRQATDVLRNARDTPDQHSGMQGEAFGISAELAATELGATLTAPSDALSRLTSVWTEGLLALHGSRGEGGEKR